MADLEINLFGRRLLVIIGKSPTAQDTISHLGGDFTIVPPELPEWEDPEEDKGFGFCGRSARRIPQAD